ncbi:hypothetical protein SAMN04489859_103413 [Paracoccus alcaliphilus]|uniref:Uncharacterized protein n=1 Tax=Paracoccus alcaliphilus TaxID=34002 RepID=A0A1H8LWI4_9RHOB|nr:hypothetical protein [Paracoccus alcaliphilus]SEO09248.1 hypothetical protein SAMN04489859_103413 [Paracoccus alcaliphilus]
MAASAPELARKNANDVFGAMFMPFMSVTLLWILNTNRVPPAIRLLHGGHELMLRCRNGGEGPSLYHHQ